MTGSRQDCCNCSCQGGCPYGLSFIAPCILATLAMVLNWSTTFGCHFLRVSFLSNPSDYKFSIGPWSVENFDETATGQIIDEGDDDDNQECVAWQHHDVLSTDRFDAPIRFVRVISLIGFISSLFAWIYLLVGGCVVFNRAQLLVIGGTFVFTAMCMILTLVMFASDFCQDNFECDFDGNGVTAIIACGVWLLAACSMFSMKERNWQDHSASETPVAEAEPASKQSKEEEEDA